jgi:group I intron endonuclease
MDQQLGTSFYLPEGTDTACGIYMIKNMRTGDFYIGSTYQASARRAEHFRNLRNGTHNGNFQPAYDAEVDKTVFKFIMFIYCKREQLIPQEQSCIDIMKPMYNESMFAGRVEMTPAMRKKISDRKKGQPAHNRGVPMSEEGKLHLSKLNTGKKASPETCEKMSAGRRGPDNPNFGNGEKIRGGKNPKAISVTELETGLTFECIKQAAEFFNVPALSISMVCLGKQKTAGGRRFVRNDIKNKG